MAKYGYMLLGAFLLLIGLVVSPSSGPRPMPPALVQSICSPVGQSSGQATVNAYNECVSAVTQTWEQANK